MDGNTPGQEKALRRREPVWAREVIGAALEGWAESSRIRNRERQRLASEIDRARETDKNLDAEEPRAAAGHPREPQQPSPARPPPPL